MTQIPYPKRSWLLSWLPLPIDLRKIKQETPADAAEVLRYLQYLRLARSSSKPRQIILTTLRQRAAEAH